MPRHAHNNPFARGTGMLFTTVLCLLSFSACRKADNEVARQVDMLNSKSYAFHYQDLDSTLALARQAYDLSGDYGTGRAEALNNIAFVDIARMRYDSADSILSSISDYTSNQVELLVADVQLMRLCQRRSANRRFYDCRESAMRRLRRIKEEPSVLDDHARRRVLYAESEMAIVTSTYL